MVNSNNIPQVNWNPGSSLTLNTMSFAEKLNVIFKKAYQIARVEGMVEGDLLYIGDLSDWTQQTYHQPIENLSGLFITKDLKKISRLAVCKSFKSNHAKFKRPVRLVNCQVVVFRNNAFVPLYKETRDWLTGEKAYAVMKEIAGGGFGHYEGSRCVRIKLNSGTYQIEHLAFAQKTCWGKTLYCLLDSGFILEADSDEVQETEVDIDCIHNSKKYSGDFIQYVNINNTPNSLRFIAKES